MPLQDMDRRQFLAGATSTVAAVAVAGCGGGQSAEDALEEVVINGARVEVGTFNATFRGNLVNESSYDFDYLRVHVEFLDADGNVLGEGDDIMENGVQNGGQWEVSVIYDGDADHTEIVEGEDGADYTVTNQPPGEGTTE